MALTDFAGNLLNSFLGKSVNSGGGGAGSFSPVDVAKSLKWDDPSKFQVQITGVGASLGNLDSVTPDILTAAITSISLAEINTTPVEEYIGEEWRFATGRLENYLMTITMKDFNGYTLYKIWSKAIQKFSREYPDSQKFDVVIFVADDFNINSFKPIVTYKDCILVTVSGPTLDNAAVSTIAEFNVIMKCSYLITN